MMRKHFLLFVLLSLSPLLLSNPAVVHAQWEPDRRLTFDDSLSRTSTNKWAIATSRDTVHVVWNDTRDGNAEIYYKRSIDGGINWGSDIRLTSNPASSWSPSIAVSGSNVHIAWHDFRVGNFEIYYKFSTDGGASWSVDTRLTNSYGSSTSPTISVSDSNVYIVWEDDRNRIGWYEIYFKRSTNGGSSWGLDTRLTNDTAQSLNPSVGASGSIVHVVCCDGRDGNSEVYYTRSSDKGASWGLETRLTYDSAGSGFPSVAALGSKAHVIWQDERHGNPEIYYKRSTDGGGTWSPDIRLTNDPDLSRSPTIAVSGSYVHVAWHDYRDGSPEIYYKRSTDEGASWERDTRITNDSAWAFLPSVAVSGPKIHVVWWDWRDGNDEIYYTRNPTGNGVEVIEIPSPFSPLPFSVFPNPFTSFTTVPGQSSDRFTLYDISGRRVGVYKGDRIGEGLRAGVYFIRALEGKAGLVRIVKIR